ncbi:MAG: glucosidase, partial [Cytophagales bacterium]
RQWGTVREDYSPDGSAWEYFPHDMARSRAYRWGEDGIMGWCDVKQLLCFSVGMWNERDPIIKERLFGLTGNQGNHGEDVKEYYYYLESTPTHSYVKQLYKYPQSEFPYSKIIFENEMRGRHMPEYNLIDTGVFDKDKYFDVFTEYAKASREDILIEITVVNKGPEKAAIHLIPQLWFRNLWAWVRDPYQPFIKADKSNSFYLEHKYLGNYHFYYDGAPEPMFCNNDTNHVRVFGHKPTPGFWKDGINDYIITGNPKTINPARTGTKSALRYKFNLAPGASGKVRLRLSMEALDKPFSDFNEIFNERRNECDLFFDELQKNITDSEDRAIQRQAIAGMLITNNFIISTLTFG